MSQIPIKLGPLALLLTVISICLTTLSILTYTTASADMRLASRFADTVQERYALEVRGQEFLKEASESLDSGDTIWLEEMRSGMGRYQNVIEQGDSSLTIGFTMKGLNLQVDSWQVIRNWSEDNSLNIWQGTWD